MHKADNAGGRGRDIKYGAADEEAKLATGADARCTVLFVSVFRGVAEGRGRHDSPEERPLFNVRVNTPSCQESRAQSKIWKPT